MQILGEIRAFTFGAAPQGWLPCNGKLLNITQYEALYTLIGTIYGGDGKTTFALPALNGRVLVGSDESQGGSYVLGTAGGSEFVTLYEGQEAPHSHDFLVAKSDDATALAAATNMPGDNESLICNALFVSRDPSQVMKSFNNADATLQTTLDPASITSVEGGAPHYNCQPYLTVNYCIAVIGSYPSNQNQ